MNYILRRVALLLLSSGMIWTAAACAKTRQDDPIPAVRGVMEAQQAAWNRGDIEAFMDGYERAESTTFISGDELTRGWQTVLDRYKRRYSSREQMGTLTFSDLDVQPINSEYAIADGRWRLALANGSPHGRFTLIFKRSSAGWRIIHDTTTAAQ